jgi:hypothetical protein
MAPTGGRQLAHAPVPSPARRGHGPSLGEAAPTSADTTNRLFRGMTRTADHHSRLGAAGCPPAGQLTGAMGHETLDARQTGRTHVGRQGFRHAVRSRPWGAMTSYGSDRFAMPVRCQRCGGEGTVRIPGLFYGGPGAAGNYETKTCPGCGGSGWLYPDGRPAPAPAGSRSSGRGCGCGGCLLVVVVIVGAMLALGAFGAYLQKQDQKPCTIPPALVCSAPRNPSPTR